MPFLGALFVFTPRKVEPLGHNPGEKKQNAMRRVSRM